jgi:methionine sulfoxide reductase heme-binding subunit
MNRDQEQASDLTLAVQFGLPVLALLAAVAFAASGAGSNTVWYVVRATGIIAYLLVTLTVAGGLLVSNRSLPAGQPRVDVYEVHRFISLLAISAAGFHALTLLLESYIGFSPSQIVIPFTSSYRPVAVALGIMALYGAIAVYASFYLKRWIGQSGWRKLHYTSFAIFALASYHGILSGADTRQVWMLAIYLGAIAAVLGLTIFRVSKAAEAEASKDAAGARRRAAVTRPANAKEAAAARRPDAPFVSELVWRPPARGGR